jgi:hypothetical protein
MFATLSRLWPFSSNAIGNADAVFDAIAEQSNFGFKYVGTLGEPDVVDRGGEYTTELNVVVPLTTENPDYPDPANLEFPLPEGMEDESAGFFDLLDRFGIDDLSLLGDVEGKNVPLSLENGTLVPLWEEVADAATTEE